MEKRLVAQTLSSLLNFEMLFRLDFAIIKAVITVKPYLVYSHIWLNLKNNKCHFRYKQNSLKKHIFPLFLLYRQIFNQLKISTIARFL